MPLDLCIVPHTFIDDWIQCISVSYTFTCTQKHSMLEYWRHAFTCLTLNSFSFHWNYAIHDTESNLNATQCNEKWERIIVPATLLMITNKQTRKSRMRLAICRVRLSHIPHFPYIYIYIYILYRWICGIYSLGQQIIIMIAVLQCCSCFIYVDVC